MLTVQDALIRLQKFWTDRGCMVVQPYNTEVGAGTMNPATVMRVLGPEPWRVAYVEPSVRPDDSRYGENPNRLQTHTQFQVILKPEPGNPQELYLESLAVALDIDLDAHDVRFVEDNWQQPAIGAWGLGWEVWLDGMEVTQFTYFQQVTGQNVDPVSVELTYGIERIMMAQQGVTHFKDMQYAPGLTYGEVFGQVEYEMSRYYLDDADIDANRDLFGHYTAEAQRLIDARLPVPAWTYVLKSSHAFNVLDSRGAVSTTERARSFSEMRRLAREVGQLWVERRAEIDFPLLKQEQAAIQVGSATQHPTPAAIEAGPSAEGGAQTLAIEIGVEELPPHVVGQAVEQVREVLAAHLKDSRLEHGDLAVAATPRRIVATVADVAAAEPDGTLTRKGPKVTAAFDADGNPTKACEGFARGQKVDVADLVRAEFDGVEHVAVEVAQPGRGVAEVVSEAVVAAVTGLRADKNMRWNDPELSYSRPIRWLVVLWGEAVVPVEVSSLRSGRVTYLQRGDTQPLATVAAAADLLPLLAQRGIVLETTERRESVVSQANSLASSVGGVIETEREASLIDEITNLVEEPVGILGNYDEKYLKLPEQILTSVMAKHQRYLPVRDASGVLMPHFVTMANGSCNADVVRGGNESVLRARYEDAAFFYDSDLKVPLADLRNSLTSLTFEDRVGSVAQRADRIADVAAALSQKVEISGDDAGVLTRAGELAKFDLGSQMVVEMSSLAGLMAREYALKAGESEAVATALWEMELPRQAGDAVPDSLPGALLSLGDRFDLLIAMFAIGAKPTGSSDPFALRRAALGVIAVLRATPALAGVTVRDGLEVAADRLRTQGVEVSDESVDAAAEFVVGRFGQSLRDEGVSAALVEAVEPLAQAPGKAEQALTDIAAAREDQQFGPLVEQVQRITRIVPADTAADFDASVLTEPSEAALVGAVDGLADHSGDGITAWLTDASGIVEPLRTFFDDVLVMAEDEAVRASRLGLLQTVVAKAPAGIDWKALDSAL
ncbi:glycine--tRNA ligase [Dermacoccaceae bacterium W4C1]